MEQDFVREPKQTRSRESFDRMLDAAAALIEEGGLAALTLGAVSRRSKVSIGSIYCRVDGKDALVRALQARTLARMIHEFELMLARVRRRELPLHELVPVLVRELALFLRRHSRQLSAFMQQSQEDPAIGVAGRKSWHATATGFQSALLERRADFRHPDPDHAAEMCFTVVYGCLARFLGLGNSGVNEGNWNQLIDDLGLMALGFVALDLKKATRPARRR